jgi:hypothetical protein
MYAICIMHMWMCHAKNDLTDNNMNDLTDTNMNDLTDTNMMWPCI